MTSLSFYVTVGRGTESFANCEIRRKFSQKAAVAMSPVNFVSQIRDGKIIFEIAGNTEHYIEKLLGLKCVERAFVKITDYENNTKGKREFLDRLMQTMSAAQTFDTAQKVMDQLRLVLSNINKKVKINTSSSTMSHKAASSDEPCSKKIRLSEDSSCDEVKNSPESDKLLDDEKQVFKTFRMSVKCTGKSRRWIDIKKLSKDLSRRVSRTCDWLVDLRSPDFEICLHISDCHVTAGIPLTSIPLSRRPFIMDPGLRAPVAWIMVQLADIKPGDVILDPMCGKGTLLLEAYSHLKDACYIGVDKDLSQIQVAQQNVFGMSSQKHINLFHADGLCLPFKPLSVNRVICDAPFNQKHFTSTKADDFYVTFLEEMYRILCEGGSLVLLTSQEFSSMITPLLLLSKDNSTCDNGQDLPSEKIASDKKSNLDVGCNARHKFTFQFVSKHYMKLGESHGEIIVMVKL